MTESSPSVTPARFFQASVTETDPELAHAIGLSRSGEASPLRAAGVAATWAAYIFLAAALLCYALP